MVHTLVYDYTKYMSLTIDFSDGPKTREFVLTLHEVFPLIEHFLTEQHWATIVFFLSSKTTDVDELREIKKALRLAQEKFERYYPSFMPPTPNTTGRYSSEGVMASAVFSLVQVLIDLQELSEGFIATMERGKDPTR